MGASQVKSSPQSEPIDLSRLVTPREPSAPKHVSFADETTSQSQLSWSGFSGRLSLLSGRLSSLSSLSWRGKTPRQDSTRSVGGRPWSRVSRKRWNQSTLEDPLHSCKTAWPVTLAESLFISDFPIKDHNKGTNYEVIKTLGSGAFGKVYQVKHKQSGDLFAMKVLSKAHIVREGAISQVKDEVSIQSACGHHPYIVGCPERWQSRKQLYVLQELVLGGELRDLLLRRGSLHEELVQLYVAELATALDFLHNAGVIFRDLKLENVLLDDALHVKLIDFGLAKWLRFGSRTATLCGTLQYMAPELLEMQPYTHAVDWWSLGVLAFCLLSGTYPVAAERDPEAMLGAVSAAPGRLSRHVSAPARALVARLLTLDPRHRLTSLLKLSREAWYMNYPLDAVRAREIPARDIYDKYYAVPTSPSSGTGAASEDFIDLDASTVDDSFGSWEFPHEFPDLPDGSPRRAAAAASTPSKTLNLVDTLEAEMQPPAGAGQESADVVSSPDSVVASSGVMSPHRTFAPAPDCVQVSAVVPIAAPRRASHETLDVTSSVDVSDLRLRDGSSEGAECACEAAVSEAAPAPVGNLHGTRAVLSGAGDVRGVRSAEAGCSHWASHSEASRHTASETDIARVQAGSAQALSPHGDSCSFGPALVSTQSSSNYIRVHSNGDQSCKSSTGSNPFHTTTPSIDAPQKRTGCVNSSAEEFDCIWKRPRTKVSSSWEESSSERLRTSGEAAQMSLEVSAEVLPMSTAPPQMSSDVLQISSEAVQV